ncbi:MAG: aminopeptidase P family N-terminal domain-containing protein, partial [Pygmaiobacter sp.]
MENRIAKLATLMPQGFEAALIKTEANRFYFLDLDVGDAGTVLVLQDSAYFIIDSRYIEIARREVTSAEVVLETKPLVQIAELLKQHGASSLYIEDGVSMHYFAELQKALPGIALLADSTLMETVESMRQIKDEEEVARMREAQRITDDCFTYICGQIHPGLREIDLALLMESYMRSHGAT